MAGEEKELFMCDTTPEAREAYERLIGDALRGDPTLFSRQDGVEAAWAIVDPVLHAESRPTATSAAAGGHARPTAWWRRLVGGVIRQDRACGAGEVSRETEP